MKKSLAEILICPKCLPRERPLRLKTQKGLKSEILSGELHCKACRSSFVIKEGIPILLRNPLSITHYESDSLIGNYLFLHYGDLLGHDSEQVRFYKSLLEGSERILEVGCGPGRLSLEVAVRAQLTIGIDISFGFVRAAQKLSMGRTLSFFLPLEGELKERHTIQPPEGWEKRNVHFLVADALYLPFPNSFFDTLISINLIDRVPDPLRSLAEMNRVTRKKEALLLIADPFSWSSEFTHPSKWLGGRKKGRFKDRGFDNLIRLLQGSYKVFDPPFTSLETGRHRWALRVHENKQELITSLYIKAKR